jgi:hypothetical protein
MEGFDGMSMRLEIEVILDLYDSRPPFVRSDPNGKQHFVDRIIKIVRDEMVNREEHNLQRIVADEEFIREARSIPKPKVA